MEQEKGMDLIVMTEKTPGEPSAYTTTISEEEARMLEAVSEPMDEEMKKEALLELLDDEEENETEEEE